MKLILIAALLISVLAIGTVSANGPVKGQMLFTASTGGSWENSLTWRPVVVYDGSTFMMWYTGENSAHVDNIGLATSKDGISWTRFAQNPVLKVGGSSEWDHGSVYEQWVIHDQGAYKMWYSGVSFETDGSVRNVGIGYATSNDGISWTKDANNPVLAPGAAGEWDDGTVWRPIVVATGTSYTMLYSANSRSGGRGTGVATSNDGIHWTKAGKFTMPTSQWDSNLQSVSSLLKAGNTYVLGYGGRSSQNGPVQIGFATSTDLAHWSLYSNNPVVTYGSGTWDSGGVTFPDFVVVGNNYYVYYSAYKTGERNKSIGLASLPIP